MASSGLVGPHWFEPSRRDPDECRVCLTGCRGRDRIHGGQSRQEAAMALERQRALGLRRVASVGRPGAVGEDQDRPDVYLGGIRFP